jgi:hypothetical protein
VGFLADYAESNESLHVLTPTALPTLAAAAGERVSIRFLEFAVIICASEGRGST